MEIGNPVFSVGDSFFGDNNLKSEELSPLNKTRNCQKGLNLVFKVILPGQETTR